MRRHFRLIISVMILVSILLFLVIIGPEVSGSIEAADKTEEIEKDQSDTEQTPDTQEVQPAGNMNGTTPEAIEEEENKIDVNCEIVQPKVAFDLKYNQYPLTYTYLLVQNPSIHVRKGPSIEEPVLMDVKKNEKLDYIETISNGDTWYHVSWKNNGQTKFGFVNAAVVTKRVFQFDNMYEKVKAVEREAQNSMMTYIANYQNRKGYAPLYHGQKTDANGGRQSQSAPGYLDPFDLNEFSYLGDGTIVKVMSADSKYTKVSLVGKDQVYYVPNKYVATPAAIGVIKKAVVIDRTNQNEAVFEKTGQEWKVISYTMATTGKIGEYHQPTPLGYYYAMERRERFYYYKDGTTSIQGYAPFALRFAGGAYIHGVPVNFNFTAEGVRVDPGRIEFSKTIGTVPLSHKCVRNYTSHAKFLYDWYSAGETIVIVIE